MTTPDDFLALRRLSITLDAGKLDFDSSIDFNNCTALEDDETFRMPSEDVPVDAAV